MRATFALLLATLALPAFAEAPKIQSVTPAASESLKLDAYRVFRVGDYKGVVSWETDPVYEIGYDDKGKPILVSGEVDLLELTVPAKLPQREGLKLIDVDAGGAVVWGKKAGKVRLVARGVIDGVPKRLDTQVLEIEGLKPAPPPIGTDPPPPETPTGKLYFLIARPNGPVQSDVLKSLQLPAWAEITKAGHQYKDLPVNEIKTKSGKSPIPNGTTLPCVLPLRIEGDSSYLVGAPYSLPKSDADVRRLLEVKP